MNFLVVFCAVFLMHCVAGGSSMAASFDCTKAATNSEKLICGDQKLSVLDDRLTEAYRATMKKATDKDALKKEQQNWIKTERDGCLDVACLLKAYEARIAALEGHTQKTVQELLQEADGNFTFRGKPINPLALKELLPWLSDSLPGPVAVDVEGSTPDTDRYSGEIAAPEKGLVKATWKSDEGEAMLFQYKRLGTLTNGMHVVETWSRSGGSGVFMDLLLVRFQIDTEYTEEGTLRNRLLMMRTGQFSLGDRYDGVIKVQPGEITIEPGKRDGGERRVISFK